MNIKMLRCDYILQHLILALPRSGCWNIKPPQLFNPNCFGCLCQWD